MTSVAVPQWQADAEAADCNHCRLPFSFRRRRHHCRRCGLIFCDDCTKGRMAISGSQGKERVCITCTNRAGVPTIVPVRKVCVLGVSGVGKSSLVSRLIRLGSGGPEPAAGHDSTRAMAGRSSGSIGHMAAAASDVAPGGGSERAVELGYGGQRYRVRFFEGGGERGIDLFQAGYTIGATAFLLVFSITDATSLTALQDVHSRILDCGGFGQPCVLVATKADQGQASTVKPEAAREVAAQMRASYTEVSISDEASVQTLHDMVLGLCCRTEAIY